MRVKVSYIVNMFQLSMRRILPIFFLLLIVMFVNSCHQHSSLCRRIGILVPVEHVSMEEVVQGFSETLHQLYSQPVEIEIMNAKNDLDLQRNLIQKMRDEKFILLVPIGSSATQMAQAIVKEQPIIGLGATLSKQEQQKLHPCNITVVDDEIPPQDLLAFIHAAYPQLKRMTLIHSASDRVFEEVEQIIARGKQYGIEVLHVMAATQPEVSSAATLLSPQTQAIFVLKDHLIVSGISDLVKVAEQRHIPLITSDQGSVQEGATFALGVHERDIGVEGAHLAAQVLAGKPICSLPIKKMKKIIVFVNHDTVRKSAQNRQAILDAAKKSGYQVEFIE
jgi:putative ABC transport system substrate-binding protein